MQWRRSRSSGERARYSLAVVTGASRGLGSCIARALAGSGMQLVLAARAEAELRAVGDECTALGARTLCVPTDVTVASSLHQLVARAESFGEVDVLINNAGVEDVADFSRISVQRIHDALAVNIRAPMLLTRLLLPAMIARRRGHILTIASLAGLSGGPYNECYAASKHAVMGFMRSLRETARAEDWGVGVSTVVPGFVSGVGMYADAHDKADFEQPRLMGTSPPEAVVRAVLRALASNDAEIIVNPTPIRPLLALASLFPGLPGWIIRRTGIRTMYQKRARMDEGSRAS